MFIKRVRVFALNLFLWKIRKSDKTSFLQGPWIVFFKNKVKSQNRLQHNLDLHNKGMILPSLKHFAFFVSLRQTLCISHLHLLSVLCFNLSPEGTNRQKGTFFKLCSHHSSADTLPSSKFLQLLLSINYFNAIVVWFSRKKVNTALFCQFVCQSSEVTCLMLSDSKTGLHKVT